jgi:hypothetical protein
MSAIRIEADGPSDLSLVHLWLARHRGEVVELDSEKRLTLGAPISGARAVIVAAVLENGVGGVLRALENTARNSGVRFVFDVRSTRGLSEAEVRSIGAEVVDEISRQIAEGDPVSKVA